MMKIYVGSATGILLRDLRLGGAKTAVLCGFCWVEPWILVLGYQYIEKKDARTPI
jgi:hypothetical protein